MTSQMKKVKDYLTQAFVSKRVTKETAFKAKFTLTDYRIKILFQKTQLAESKCIPYSKKISSLIRKPHEKTRSGNSPKCRKLSAR